MLGISIPNAARLAHKIRVSRALVTIDSKSVKERLNPFDATFTRKQGAPP
jgi:transcriptional antiterminator